jgi:hypothetical protein
MAKQTIGIGSAANDGTGDPLRTAFDKINDNFTELYNDETTGEVNSITATAPLARDSAVGAVTISLADLGIATGKIADDAVTADKLANSINTAIAANTAKVTNATHTGDVTGATALTIANDVVGHDQLSNRYTAASAVTSAAAITIDTATADVFTWTAGHSTTVAFTNVKIGSTCTLQITGSGGSFTLALGNINGSSGTFNKLGGTYSDTGSAKNLIEFKFISTSEAWYQISQIGS